MPFRAFVATLIGKHLRLKVPSRQMDRALQRKSSWPFVIHRLGGQYKKKKCKKRRRAESLPPRAEAIAHENQRGNGRGFHGRCRDCRRGPDLVASGGKRPAGSGGG